MTEQRPEYAAGDALKTAPESAKLPSRDELEQLERQLAQALVAIRRALGKSATTMTREERRRG